jgi:glutamate-5-semialdehyde dehydrogenase
MAIIINGKTSNISVCNALDKVLIDTNIPHWKIFAKQLVTELQLLHVSVLGDASVADVTQVPLSKTI